MVARNNQISELLHQAQLSETLIRRQVIGLLWGEGVALTQKELEEKLPKETDRVTLYRTLKLFLEKNLIHKIIIDETNHKYKLAGAFRKSDHAHFHCVQCNKLLCMPHLNIDTSQLPPGFEIHSARLVIEGVCNHCSNKNKG